MSLNDNGDKNNQTGQKIQSKIAYKQKDDILHDDSQGLRTSENCHNF